MYMYVDLIFFNCSMYCSFTLGRKVMSIWTYAKIPSMLSCKWMVDYRDRVWNALDMWPHYLTLFFNYNSLQPSDAIWPHRSGKIIIDGILCVCVSVIHTSFTVSAQDINSLNEFGKYNYKYATNLLWSQWVKYKHMIICSKYICLLLGVNIQNDIICGMIDVTNVRNWFLIPGSNFDLKFQSNDWIRSVFRCYQVEGYTAICLTSYLQTYFKQTNL